MSSSQRGNGFLVFLKMLSLKKLIQMVKNQNETSTESLIEAEVRNTELTITLMQKLLKILSNTHSSKDIGP